MKGFLRSKNWIKKIWIAVVILISFNFVAPNYSQAATIGGDLFQPFAQLLCGIGDLVLGGLQYLFMGGDSNVGEDVPNGGRHYIYG